MRRLDRWKVPVIALFVGEFQKWVQNPTFWLKPVEEVSILSDLRGKITLELKELFRGYHHVFQTYATKQKARFHTRW